MPKPALALGQTAARGFAWFLGQTVGSKLVNVAGQVALAYLLKREDFGFVSLAYAVATFAALIQQAGIKEILIQRARHFQRWADAAFWMSLAFGLLSSLAMVAAAPLAALVFHEPRVIGLILLLAVGNLFQSLSVVPEAKAQVDLRFRALAWIGWLATSGAMLLSVLFAAAGLGAYSFVLPLQIAALFRLIALWRLSGVPLHFRLRRRRWRYLVSDSGLLLASSLFVAITWQADYVILGYLYDKDVVGLYFWAFNLSGQMTQVLALNAAMVLFPSLSRMQGEPARQRAAFVRAARALAFIGFPIYFLQAALADSAVRIVFGTQWYSGISIIQILSIGMVPQMVSIPALSVIKAQGRFRSLTMTTMLCALVFVLVVFVGAKSGAAVGAAIGVAIYSWTTAPLPLYEAVRCLGGDWRDVKEIYLRPTAISLLAIAVAVAAASLVPGPGLGACWLRLLLIAAVAAGIYLPLIRRQGGDVWKEISEKDTCPGRPRRKPMNGHRLLDRPFLNQLNWTPPCVRWSGRLRHAHRPSAGPSLWRRSSTTPGQP